MTLRTKVSATLIVLGVIAFIVGALTRYSHPDVCYWSMAASLLLIWLGLVELTGDGLTT